MIELGTKIGNLTVTEIVYSSKVKAKNILNCVCDCGNSVEVSERSLNKGRTSCGCKSFATKDPDRTNVLLKKRYRKLISRHISKSDEEIISLERFKELSTSPCFYCGVSSCRTVKEEGFEVAINGIDRIDSSKGYTKDNTVSCCTTCNCAKSTMSTDEFRDWVVLIYNSFVNKN